MKYYIINEDLVIGFSLLILLFFILVSSTIYSLINKIQTTMTENQEKLLAQLQEIKTKQDSTNESLANIKSDTEGLVTKIDDLIVQIEDLKRQLEETEDIPQEIIDAAENASISAGEISEAAKAIADSVPDAPKEEE